MTINLSDVGKAAATTVRVLYKAAFLYLAYQFVTASIGFYGFAARAAQAFYVLGQHPGVGT